MAVSVCENVYSSRQMSGRPERRDDPLTETSLISWLMVRLSGGNQSLGYASDFPGTLGELTVLVDIEALRDEAGKAYLSTYSWMY